MKLDSQQSTLRNPLRILYVTAAVTKRLQLSQGWYKVSVSNYYGYPTSVVCSPDDASTPNANPYVDPALNYTTQGRVASTNDPLEFYVDDSGITWRFETYGQYATLVYIEGIPAPTRSKVSP